MLDENGLIAAVVSQLDNPAWSKVMSATAIYAERNQGLADEAARKLG